MSITLIRRLVRSSLMGLAVLCFSQLSAAAKCEAEDFVTRVTGAEECVLIATFGQRTASPNILVIWLHGDHSGGGPATSHMRPAREVASRFTADGVVAVALWRPGYGDQQGNASGGDLNGRSDHYTQANMAIVGDAIARLKEHWKPARTILVGHSGGAATVANVIGMRPDLAERALLLSCPCDLRAWRARRSWWPRSQDPMQWIGAVASTVKVIAMTGESDDNTTPALASKYVEALAARGVDARFDPVPGVGHNSILDAPQVMDAVGALIR